MDTWIAGSLVGWLASLLIGVLLLLPEEAKAIREAQRLVDASDTSVSAALRDAIGSKRVVIGEWTTVVLLVAMAALMAFKPL